MARALLAVFSNPGDLVSIDEFQDWYDNEHVPLRLNHLHSFLNGARYSAVHPSSDPCEPTWLAIYDIDDYSTFSKPEYTRLRANRSSRESDLVKRLAILDRRTLECLGDTGKSELTTSFEPSDTPGPSRGLITHTVAFDPQDNTKIKPSPNADDTAAWLNHVASFLQKNYPGWVRTRTFKVVDISVTKRGISDSEAVTASYFATHELVSEDDSLPSSKSLIESSCGEVPVRIGDFMQWKLYRAYPCIAQNNIVPHACVS
ncbi:hypothetical protein FISHEDRAFT_67467 [Fistulina hepatica ATCC 64428]|uniref:EthD domain-containing protein n=1 Tax=Fistulina hepatica ATCC 64428 TaxID=1128425 RepID=A0A0D6ZZW4_9AGAR|nr:hypothetical protein FISHEDRAFT_67467 [Fistulina hepatica ATCC 64428]